MAGKRIAERHGVYRHTDMDITTHNESAFCVRRITLAEGPDAARWMREKSHDGLVTLAHFWDRLPLTSKFAQPDLHLVAVLPEETAWSPVADWAVCRGVMLYVPHAHRAEVFAVDGSAADHLAMYLAGWERLLRGPQAENSPITIDESPSPLQFLTGDASTVAAMLPQMLKLVRRRAAVKIVTNYVMALDAEAPAAEHPNVRPAKAEDEVALNRWRRLYSQERGILFEANVLDGVRAGKIFVYDTRGEIASVAKFDLELPGHIEIGGVYTFPELRSKGYGRALMEDLSYKIRRQGKTPLLQVDESNLGAYKMYLRLGWAELGRLSRVWLASS